jgi:hypothetical protein
VPEVTIPTDWQFDASISRYRNTSTGQFVGSQAVTQLRNDFLDAQLQVVADLTRQFNSGVVSLSAWQTAMQEAIKVTLGVEYVFGRGGLNQITPADLDVLSGLVAAQFDYLSNFAQAIDDGALSGPQIAARADMYLGAGVGAYERGAAAASGIDLPEYPGEACDGLTNCRCAWLIDLAEDGSIEAFWICENDTASCSACIENGDTYNPWTQE